MNAGLDPRVAAHLLVARSEAVDSVAAAAHEINVAYARIVHTQLPRRLRFRPTQRRSSAEPRQPRDDRIPGERSSDAPRACDPYGDQAVGRPLTRGRALGDECDRRGPNEGRRLRTDCADPRELGSVLMRHKLAAEPCAPTDFVFATRTGSPLQQRNVGRALREAQARATDGKGRPAFPILHETDARGLPLAVPRGTLPSMHSFRHTVASRARLAGESVDEVAFLLGNRAGTVTRTVYVREVADAAPFADVG